MALRLALKMSKAALEKEYADGEIVDIADSNTNSDDDLELNSNEPRKKIQWQDLNYPCGFHIVHYDLRELDKRCASIASQAHYAAILVYLTLIMNLVDVCILATMNVYPLNIMYSFFNLFLIAPPACLNFYLAFLVLAMSGKMYYKRYMSSQVIMCILYLVLSILGEGPVNGWTKFMYRSDATSGLSKSGATFWSASIIMESTCYTMSFIIGVYIAMRVRSAVQIPPPSKVVS